MDMAMELELQVGNDQSKHQTNPTGEEKEIKEDNQEEQVENGHSEQEEQLPNPTNGEENQEEQAENGESEQEEQPSNPTAAELTTEDEKEEGLTTKDEKEEEKVEKIISVVLRANLRCDRCKTRVLKDISREHGVNSISIDKNNIRVTGNMDPIGLRKRKASVNLASVHGERPPLERKMVSSYLRPKAILDKKKVVLKWMFILMNVGLELCQAVTSQEAGDGKIKGSVYRKLSVILSSICLTLSFVELLEEGKRGGVKWQRKRGCYCFYYPGKYGQMLGKFSLWFGLISAIVQFSLNVASLVIKRGVFKFDHLGLLLSVNYLLAALGGERSVMLAKVRCSLHGRNEAEGELVEGMWEFHCPECPPEKLV